MKIEICNLNDISRAEIDLRPLTIFIGPNNMGKTWIAYILSGIFGLRGWEEYSQAYARGQLPKSYPSLDAAIEDVLAKGNATIDLLPVGCSPSARNKMTRRYTHLHQLKVRNN